MQLELKCPNQCRVDGPCHHPLDCRLPPSLMSLTGLSSLSILAAEFAYDVDTDLYMFDVSPLAACCRLHTLLLELHGAKSSQHDLRGLAQLQHLQVTPKLLTMYATCRQQQHGLTVLLLGLPIS